jgi:hypothetical protein
MSRYESALPLTLPPGFLTVKDVTRVYGSGVASWPRVRLALLVEGPTTALEDDVILEAKELADSSWPAAFPPLVHGTSNAERVRRLARGAFRSDRVEPLWQTLTWRGIDWQVRRDSEGNKTVRVARLVGALATSEALEGLGHALGATLARIHYGREGPSAEAAAIMAAIALAPEDFVREQATIGVSMALRTRDDHAAFRRAVDAGGRLLGFPTTIQESMPEGFRALIGAPFFKEPLQ